MKLRGFTLIELLVVIAIVGLLATIVFATLGASNAKGRDARRISEIRQIKYALELYYDLNNKYPACLYYSASTNASNRSCPVSLESSGLMSNVPRDPSGDPYTYTAFSMDSSPASCFRFHLGVSLEDRAANTVALSSDKDFAITNGSLLDAMNPGPQGFCTGAAGDFRGLSFAAGGSVCDSLNGGTAATETCYDFTE
ncbi:MAG TPA: prepilin-type N-terminal cleavage/methylation domain-containing protein [Candidatus Paceibacterota bacterium]